ncbi:MAG: htrA 1, partial [Verrucomicrobiaceae bacterium]|nr:htrA 1 [Verrucomicrobiaceae bacterium]
MKKRFSPTLPVIFGLVIAASLTAQAAKPKPPPVVTSSPLDEGAIKIVEKVKPSIVKIIQMGRDGADGLGSGFIISEDGLIATNMHVVGQARRLQVETSDGKTYEVKSVHASDHHVDLAILRVAAKGLKPLVLGNSDETKQGQPIVAMGNPQGLAFSVVQGVVSAIREVEGNSMIQLAVPIEQGNSGGPLMDRQGRVLGMLTLKSTRTENLGFAMPVNELKKLLAKPNPVPMERWLTIGVLDPRLWKPLLGARWTQRATVVKSELPGEGFGGRTLCLSQGSEPSVPFELAVSVKLDDESGAAGLVFCSDGADRSYGFYPTAGQLRLTRFDGPDVFSWTPFQTVESSAYHPGEWNDLRVRVEEKHITCYVNGQKVIEQDDDEYRSGKAGLVRFRAPGAQYKNFRVGSDLTDKPISAEIASQVTKALDAYATKPSSRDSTVDSLLADTGAAHRLVVERAKKLEQEAAALRKLDIALQQKNMARALAKELTKPEDKIDLFHAALLLAKHDNQNVDPGM